MTRTFLSLLWRAVLALTVGLAVPTAASALPAFARQTGSECSSCHVGGMGPHLTPYGMRFKMSGYTDGDRSTLPLSAQLRLSHNEPAAPSNESPDRVDEASVYLAGRLAPNIGSFLKVMHSNDPFNTGSKAHTELNHVDVRYADTTQLDGKDLVWGVTLNNAPGVTDPMDANQAWGFPAIGTSGSLFNGGTTPTLPHHVLGLTTYGLLNGHWYAEVGGYRPMSRALQDKLGQDPQDDPGNFSGIAPYWRLAYLRDMKTQFFGAGLFGMNARRQLAVLTPQPLTTARSGPYDSLRDVGIDAVYEYLGNREHVVQLRAMSLREMRRYGASPTNPYTGAVAPTSVSVRESTLAATYVFRESYGITTALMRNASTDPVRDYPFGRTDTKARYTEIFWTPFGKEDSWAAPWANLRLSAVWTRFDKFNGGTQNVFGPFSPNAGDLNFFQIYAQLTI